MRWGEFQRSIAHEAALFESVSSRLAAAANTTADTLIEPSDDALMRACRTVGQFMGIEVRTPQRSSDETANYSRDPLGDLARASGFQVRPITLTISGGVAVPASRCSASSRANKAEPVALIPVDPRLGRSRPAYELLIRTGQVRPVDLALAGRIAPAAWAFYRPFPTKR